MIIHFDINHIIKPIAGACGDFLPTRVSGRPMSITWNVNLTLASETGLVENELSRSSPLILDDEDEVLA